LALKPRATTASTGRLHTIGEVVARGERTARLLDILIRRAFAARLEQKLRDLGLIY
jgi:hypothetical protein